jgi:seryl-tRNA synthetase
MLDLKFIRNHMDDIEQMLQNRNTDVDLSEFRSIDTRRRQLLTEAEGLKNKRNTCSDSIALLKRQKEDASAQIAEMREVSREIKQLDAQVSQLDEQLDSLIYMIPNMPHESVPVGSSAGSADSTRGSNHSTKGHARAGCPGNTRVVTYCARPSPYRAATSGMRAVSCQPQRAGVSMSPTGAIEPS